MTSYFRFDPASFGKGFITHKDWEKVSFSLLGDVATVNGAEMDIAAWALRVGATAITQKEAERLKTQYEHDGVVAEIVELEAMLMDKRANAAILSTTLSAIEVEK